MKHPLYRENVRISEKGWQILNNRKLANKISLAIARNHFADEDKLISGIEVDGIVVRYASEVSNKEQNPDECDATKAT